MISKKSVIKINDVMMYLAVAVEHLRLMVLLVCFSLMVGLLYYSYARSIYYSKSLIRLHSLPQPVDTQSVYRDSSKTIVMIQLQSERLIERTAAKRLWC